MDRLEVGGLFRVDGVGGGCGRRRPPRKRVVSQTII